MPRNDELNRLGGRIDELKNASMFNAREIADATMNSAYRVLLDMENRLQRVEKLFERVEPLK